jgi:hypothetical protein
MTAPFSGRCACGSIRYVCVRAPVAMLNCHCQDCQRSSGAPLFARSEAAPEFMSIRFATLDNQSEFQPMLDSRTSSAQPWVCLRM